MNNKLIAGIITAITIMGMTGCGFSLEKDATPISEPAESEVQQEVVQSQPAVPTPTVTPLPTVTSVPRAIGQKSSDAKNIYFVNSTDSIIRAMYVKASSSGEWGESIVPIEYSIRKSEKVQLFYLSSGVEGETYDVRIVDGAKNTHEIYGIEFGDMEQAMFKIKENQGYITYMSLRENTEKNTSGYSQNNDYDEAYDSYGTDMNITIYDEGTYNYDSYYDSYYDSNYDSNYDSYDNYTFNESYYNY